MHLFLISGEIVVLFPLWQPIKELRDILNDDLLRLTRCLEIYLDAFVNHLDTPKYVEKLQVLNIDKVLALIIRIHMNVLW